MESNDYLASTFAVDELSVVSCMYPPTPLDSRTSSLTFSCSFDDGTMCGMQNGDIISPRSSSVTNFTVQSPNTIPDENRLGPSFDHTTKSPNGSFLYWATSLPYTSSNHGRIRTLTVQQNTGMCIQFAYYINSTAQSQSNSTWLVLIANGCYGGPLWSTITDDSHGWQMVTISASHFACGEAFFIDVIHESPTTVAVAIDDVQVDQCKTFDPTTTTSVSTKSISTMMTIANSNSHNNDEK